MILHHLSVSSLSSHVCIHSVRESPAEIYREKVLYEVVVSDSLHRIKFRVDILQD